MLLGEPQRTPYDLVFSLWGIPVRVSPWFWAISALLGISAARNDSGGVDPVMMLIWIGVVFVSIVVHELGHALAARCYGHEPWITLHGFGGLASYHSSRESLLSKILITLAGPFAGFLFAAVVVAAIRLAGHQVLFVPSLIPINFVGFHSDQLNLLLSYLLQVNILWGLVNLLPVYPLDGGQISRELFAEWNAYDGIRYSLILSIVTAAGVAIFAFVNYRDFYVALMFGYLGFLSYQTLQAYTGRGGGRGW